MTSNQERAKQLMADSRFAFMNGQNREALNLAKEAIQLASKDPDAYQCAANACMSLGDYDNAIDYYKKAVKLDTGNGNRYFNLGYAYASAEKAGEAVKNLAKAEELGCTPENTVQLYNLLGIICFDITITVNKTAYSYSTEAVFTCPKHRCTVYIVYRFCSTV